MSAQAESLKEEQDRRAPGPAFMKYFEPARGGIGALDGLRGLAIALVFFVHYYQLFSPKLLTPGGVSLEGWIGAAGHSGVDLFFILSGYLIYRASLKPGLDIVKFWKRRVQRIYPAFLAVAGLYIALIYALGIGKLPATPEAAIPFALANLFLTIGFTKQIPALITVSWSMSYEIAYYLAAPIFAVYLRLHHWNRASRIWGILFLSVGWLAFCAAGFSSHARLAMFPAGMLLHEIYESGYRPKPSLPACGFVVATFLAGIVASGLFENPILRALGGNAPVAGESLRVALLFTTLSPLVYLALQDHRPAVAWLKTTPLRFLGNISYSFYLMHCVAIHFSVRALGLLPKVHGAWVYWAAAPLVFALAVVITIPLYLLIEKPFSLAPETKPEKAQRVEIELPPIYMNRPVLKVQESLSDRSSTVV